MTETETGIAVITETWFKDGRELDKDIEDLSLGAGLGMLCRNRKVNERGVAHGGVAVVWRETLGKFREITLKNKKDFEVLPVVASMRGHSRKLVVVACYVPPTYKKKQAQEALEYISEVVLEVKRKFNDPFIMVAGDFNQWKINETLADYSDLREVVVGATRGNRDIDKMFTNMSRSVIASGTWEPLETEGEENVRRSDHRVSYCSVEMPRMETFRWETYSYRQYTMKAVEEFRGWITMYDWKDVLEAEGSNNKTEIYQATVTAAINAFFPLRTTRRKSTDLPWIGKKLRKLIRKRMDIFLEDGWRSPRWKEMKKKTDDMLRERKRGYLDTQKGHILAEDANRNFFRHVKSFSSIEKPKQYDVRELFPGKNDSEVAEELAKYFNAVSDEFEPLEPAQIPETRGRLIPLLENYEVSARIRKFKKPKSMVRGDVFPQLMTLLSDFFAIPLTSIYNEITRTFIWPECWKQEFVTAIPKKSCPESISDLRNISCTMLASKIFESYVLDWLRADVKLKKSQYGGEKGCGTDHLLVQLWQDVLENLDDYRAGTVITSVDYSKAFNRMSYQRCLEALAKKGAYTPVIRLVATFLTNRVMTVRVGSSWSRPRQVNGGCPQGSILGVFLFNVTIDDLEDGCEHVEQEDGPVEEVESNESEEEDLDPTQVLDGPQCSTPTTRGAWGMSSPEQSPVEGLHAVSRRRRRRPWHKKGGRVWSLDGSRGEIEVPEEPNAKTEAKWKAKLARLLRFIDDGFSLSKVNFENSYGFKVNGRMIRVKHAAQSQNVFRHLVRRATEIGMKVNSQKTAMLCISDSLAYDVDAYIEDSEGNRIRGQTRIRALWMHFGKRPDMSAQVDAMRDKMRKRFWILINLKRNGFNECELVQVYKTMLRPVLDFGAVVYHSSLTDAQDEELERLQVQALRCIFGAHLSGRKLRSMAGIVTLRSRREELCDKFAAKCLKNPRFQHWFPRKTTRRSSRAGPSSEVFLESKARCSRLANSPLYYLRRRLNGKVGKTYGSRNAEYRED